MTIELQHTTLCLKIIGNENGIHNYAWSRFSYISLNKEDCANKKKLPLINNFWHCI